MSKDDDDGFDALMAFSLEGLLLVAVAFVACWVYAVHEYGWFLGLAFGWIPSAIIAAMLLGVFWVAYAYIPANAPSLKFVTLAVSCLAGLGTLAVIIALVYWGYRLLSALGTLA